MNRGSIAKQMSGSQRSLGRVSQQQRIRPSQEYKRQERIQKMKEPAHRKNIALADVYVKNINAGKITQMSQIPLALRPYIGVTQKKLNEITAARRRDRGREPRRKESIKITSSKMKPINITRVSTVRTKKKKFVRGSKPTVKPKLRTTSKPKKTSVGKFVTKRAISYAKKRTRTARRVIRRVSRSRSRRRR